MNHFDLVQAVAGSPVVLALGWTLVHFLWQGFALGLLFAIVHRAARGAGPVVRYWLGMAALAAMLLAAVVTFALVYTPGPAAGGATAMAGTTLVEPGGELAGWRALLEPLIPWAVVLWVLGLAAHAWGLAGDFRALRQITANATPLPSPWPETVDRLRRQLGIRRCVRVLESVRVGVPIVVGWLRPVIIVPPSAILGLTPRQLELIISHELAHVARLDYLFNLAQIAVETLFFFHPAVRFVSRSVRFEREHCCDDAVVARTGETLAYARALAEIEGLRCSSGLRPAAAATGGHLRGRITRLVALPSARPGAARWLAGVALTGAVAVAVFGGTQFAARKAETLATAPAETLAPFAQATPSRMSFDRLVPLASPLPARAPVGGLPPVTLAAGATAAAATVGASAAPAPPEEPAAVAAAEPTPPAQPPAVPETPPVEAVVPAVAAVADDTPPAPAPTATVERDVVSPPALAAVPELPQENDEVDLDTSTDAAAAAAAPALAAAAGSTAGTVGAESASDRADDQPSPVRGGLMAPPAEPAPTRVPAVLAGDTVTAPAARPVETQIAAAEPPVPAPAVAAGVPDAPSTGVAAPAAPSAAVPPTSPSAPAQPGLGEITGGELIRSPTPAYPRRARLNGVEGQVTVRYTVDERGRVDELEVLSAEPGKIFQASVLKSVRRWRHEPFLADGEPVGARVTRTFEFAIRKEPLAAGEKPGEGCQRVTGSRICRSRDAYQELGIVVVHNPL